MNTKVSIIIATFNAAKTLSVALDSVLKQSFQDWECIIVDGASKDNTIEIVKSYVEHDSRFRYISEPDKGIYDAFNKGWKMAKGEWIYYLGADDELLSDGLNNLYLNSEGQDVMYGNWINRIAGKKIHMKALKKETILKYSFCSHQAIMMKKEVINKMQGFDETYKVIADFDLVQRTYLAGYKFKYLPIDVAIFCIDGVSGDSIKNEWERFWIIKNNKSYKHPILLFLLMVSKKTSWKVKHYFQDIYNKS